MTCADIRDHLPDLAYDALPPEEQAHVADHLRGCSDCRRVLDELRQVRGLLDMAPAPAAHVEVATVYRTAAADDMRRLRRWRRFAIAACAAAASLLIVLASRLEFRLEGHQFVVRWQTPPAPVSTPPAVAVVPPVPTPAPTAEEWRVVNELVQALVDDSQGRDVRQQQELAQLRRQIAELRGQTARQWAEAERDITALYSAQFPTGKGANP